MMEISRLRVVSLCLTATALLVLGLFLSIRDNQPATDPKAAVSFPDPGAAPNELVLAEFRDVARRLHAGSNRYLGTAQLAQIEGQLEQPALTPPVRVGLLLKRARHQLRLGEVAAANVSMQSAFDVAPEPTLRMLRAKVLLHLREAETANCVERHNRQCCIFPLDGGGIHTDVEPARRAKATLLELLKREPNDLPAQWLLNIMAMALSEYPDGVPDRFRIPPSALESDVDLGQFIDIAPNHGLDQLSMCGGVVVEDFNDDGFLDIVTSSSDPNQSLSIHLGGESGFRNGTARSGLDVQLGGLNLVSADYDNDGDADILVLRGAWLESEGEIRNSLLRNDGIDKNGVLRFSDVTHHAGLADDAYPTQAAVWGDFNQDGALDLFVANESLKEVSKGKLGDYPCQLFLNRGNGTFTDVAEQAGVRNDRFGKGVTAGDYDNDGDFDLYVSNVGRNRLYRNDGSDANGTPKFTDCAVELGVAAPEKYSFAPWFFDFNNDGWLDLWVSAYRAGCADLLADLRGRPHRAELPRLYLNQGDGTFRDVAKQAGLAHPFLPMGANFGDLDNDGFLDVYLATGDPNFETLVPNVVLKNQNGRRFQDATFTTGLGHLQKGHGVAFADFDHDGDQDLFNQLGGFYPGDKFHNALFANPGHGNRYLVLQVVGADTNRNGIGCRVAVQVSGPGGSRTIHRSLGSVSSFGGSPLGRFEIGLGRTESIEGLSIFWPASKRLQELTRVPLDQMIQVCEDKNGFEVISRPGISLAGD